jgi:hypothetical protein
LSGSRKISIAIIIIASGQDCQQMVGVVEAIGDRLPPVEAYL